MRDNILVIKRYDKTSGTLELHLNITFLVKMCVGTKVHDSQDSSYCATVPNCMQPNYKFCVGQLLQMIGDEKLKIKSNTNLNRPFFFTLEMGKGRRRLSSTNLK